MADRMNNKSANSKSKQNANRSEGSFVKKKPFKWTSKMVADLLACLKTYKATMEFQGLDFDGDRPAQICDVRKGMAKLYDDIFGVVETSPSSVPLQELSEEEKDVYLKKKKEETTSIQRGHQRIQEEIKEIRQNFAKAVTTGTQSGSGRIVYEFYDDLITIWGGSAASKPLSFGISSAMLTAQGSSTEGESSSSSTWSQSDDDQSQPSNGQTDETPVRLKKRPAVNTVPKLIDNKRRHMEKSLSSAQRDQLLLSEAKDDKEIKQDLASSLRESSAMFNTALQNISLSMNNFGTNICKSIEMLAQAMITSNQPQPQRNQAMYFQNPNTNMQTRSFDNSQIAHQLGENQRQFYEQLNSHDDDVYQSL